MNSRLHALGAAMVLLAFSSSRAASADQTDAAPNPPTAHPLSRAGEAKAGLRARGALWAGGGILLDGDLRAVVNQAAGTARIHVERISNYDAGAWGPLYLTLSWADSPLVADPNVALPLASDLAAFKVTDGTLAAGGSLPVDTPDLPIVSPPAGHRYLIVFLTQPDTANPGYWLNLDARNVGELDFGPQSKMSKGVVSVGVRWRNPYSGETSFHDAFPLFVNGEFSYFYFSDPVNPEVFVKSLGENSSTHYQFFVGGTTTFEYTVTFAGCGRTVVFTKPPINTDGFADGAAIPKSACK
jgi:hypothetical protein